MSDPKKAEPDEDMLEFLGGIDEVNEDSPEDNFSDFLATADVDHLAAKDPPKSPAKAPPAKDEKNDEN
jgi:hypothetical protein